jgi:osmotically-inducible protein OsmY
MERNYRGNENGQYREERGGGRFGPWRGEHQEGSDRRRQSEGERDRGQEERRFFDERDRWSGRESYQGQPSWREADDRYQRWNDERDYRRGAGSYAAPRYDTDDPDQQRASFDERDRRWNEDDRGRRFEQPGYRQTDRYDGRVFQPRGSDYPSSGTYGGSYGYRGERMDRDYRSSYDDRPNFGENRPQRAYGARPPAEAWADREQGWNRGEQTMRGRPPRSYKRGDERIHDEICETIARQTNVDASEVDVEVVNGEVTLNGVVEDRRCKRELEDVAERVFGVRDIHNNLKVRKSLFNEIGDRLFGPNDDDNRSRSSGTGNPPSGTRS